MVGNSEQQGKPQSSIQPELHTDGQQTKGQKVQSQQLWLRSALQPIRKYETMVPFIIALIVIWLIVRYVLEIAGFPWFASVIAIRVIALVLIGITIGYSPQVSKLTGFGRSRSISTETISYGTSLRQRTITREADQPGKTLWDWLQLLIIPLALAVVLFILNAEQGRVSQQFADQQNRSNLLFAQQQQQTNNQLVENQQQDSILQSYIDRIGDLVLYNNLSKSKPSDPVRTLARIRTLSTLLLLQRRAQRLS
jgi:hypothetical protein